MVRTITAARAGQYEIIAPPEHAITAVIQSPLFVELNSHGLIEVDQKNPTKKIVASGLSTNCVAVAVIVEDALGQRRCGLASYDRTTIQSELKRKGFPSSLARLIDQTALLDRHPLRKTEILIMSADPEKADEAFVEKIRLEAHDRLGSEKIVIIKHGKVLPEFLSITLDLASSSYLTASQEGAIGF
jgi:hypothetical protein